MVAICNYYATDSMSAEDAASTAFIKAFKAVGEFRYEYDTSFYYWIKTIAIREVLYELRKNRNFLSLDLVTDGAIKVEAGVVASLEAKDILNCLKQLSAAQKAVFLLVSMEGFSHKEVTELLGITETNSKQLLHRAKSRLQTLINYARKDLKNGTLGN